MNKDDFAVVALDIETIPNNDAIQFLPEPEPAKNLKDPEKIEADLEKKRRAQLGKMALDALYGKICCISITNGEAKKSFCLENEKELLVFFFDFMRENIVRLVTFNGYGFDLPFIYRRAAILGITPAYSLGHWGTRYSKEKHIDVMQVFGNYKDYYSLDSMSSIFFGIKKIDLDYKLFPELMQTEAGRAQIVEYCEHDTELTWMLFEAIQNVF